jgi:flagellar assembly factor FliW
MIKTVKTKDSILISTHPSHTNLKTTSQLSKDHTINLTNEIYEFSQGLIGFEYIHQFCLYPIKHLHHSRDSLFVLESIDDPSIAFIMKKYEHKQSVEYLSMEHLRIFLDNLGINIHDIEIYFMTFNGPNHSLNFYTNTPIVLQPSIKCGMQLVLELH